MPRPHVVIIGSGFGGLFSARALARADVDVTLISKTTAHLFQPLLYQVATGILSSGEIAPATRDILRNQKNARVLLGDVSSINLNSRIVVGEKLSKQIILRYDHLIVAAGAGQSYFGNDHFATFAPGMKSIDDALELRARIFGALEMAELSQDAAERRSLMTFVIVGAGPTGVELAGQIVELCHKTLVESFRNIDTRQCRVLLLDAAPVVLPPFGPKLSAAAQKELERIGVEVKLNAMVTNLDATGLDIKNPDGSTERIDAICKVWAAGVQASPLGRTLAEQCGIETDRAGRVPVQPDLTLPGHPEVFVIGDMMALDRLPGVAQVAIQGAKYAAKKIIGEHNGTPVTEKFSYFDKGSMAVISRFGAVAKISDKVQFSGFMAWLAWLGLHLIYVVGFKNRITTLLHWTITFLGSGRSERVTTDQQLVGRLAVKQLGPAFEPTISGILDPKKIQD
ncbi:NAD(P)/FAD-dependent oxidoreductase [Micropruina sonneratiae]|uniref:NAD(P)/FAD-dependent oxidoreductase n=1 Tax=Micropruina sonneratiae TaxID=2986940 RepID=UPI002226DC01|nr:NAD(P)/FAD-dependent oxidoreductase [Micropruina sp. KQZ13P-5]MCW3158105.1 NAD(P)/FAD-dependent oxidoreductase [Micropruina sp. KQZ13P-5]